LNGKGIAQSRFTYIFPHNERANRANINDTKLRQLFGDLRRLTSISFANVYRTKKDHPAHLNDLTTENKEDAEKKH
jgi:hypothetical protein